MTDISDFGFEDDLRFTRHLVQDIGVAVVPGSSFYRRPELGAQQVRFCYCKRDETLEAAARRLQTVIGRNSAARKQYRARRAGTPKRLIDWTAKSRAVLFLRGTVPEIF